MEGGMNVRWNDPDQAIKIDSGVVNSRNSLEPFQKISRPCKMKTKN